MQSNVPRAEAAATRIIALTTACRDHFEASQIKNQDKASRREGPPFSVGVWCCSQQHTWYSYETNGRRERDFYFHTGRYILSAICAAIQFTRRGGNPPLT